MGYNRRFYPLRFILSILITEGAGGIGSLFTYGSISTWYATLAKTPITPPNWLFAPMWLTLFFLMGIALYFIWTASGENRGKWLPLTLFSIQLTLNVLWSIIFFWLHSILFGAIEIIFLWFFILATILEFHHLDRKTAYILFPYLSWVTVATILNMAILFANP